MLGVARVSVCVVLVAVFSLAVGSTEPISDQSGDDLQTLRGRVVQLYEQGNYAKDVSVAERYVALVKDRFGEEHAQCSVAIFWLGMGYMAEGRHVKAVV